MPRFSKRAPRKRRTKLAKTVVPIVKKTIRSMEEPKTNVQNNVGTTILDVGNGYDSSPLELLATGSGQSQRVGNAIKVNKIEFKGLVRSGTGTSTGEATRVRMILYRHRTEEQAVLNVGLHENIELDQFIIYKDVLFTLVKGTSAQNKYFNFTQTGNKLVKYTGGSATIADLVTPPLRLYAVSDRSSISNPPNLDYMARIIYREL